MRLHEANPLFEYCEWLKTMPSICRPTCQFVCRRVPWRCHTFPVSFLTGPRLPFTIRSSSSIKLAPFFLEFTGELFPFTCDLVPILFHGYFPLITSTRCCPVDTTIHIEDSIRLVSTFVKNFFGTHTQPSGHDFILSQATHQKTDQILLHAWCRCGSFL